MPSFKKTKYPINKSAADSKGSIQGRNNFLPQVVGSKTLSTGFNRVLIIGLGLIGGSFSLDLHERQLADHIVGYDIEKNVCRQAKKLGVIDEVLASLNTDLTKYDLVILSVPVLSMTDLMRYLSKRLNQNALVINVASTQKSIMSVADVLFPNGNFIGTHPMAGKENSGIKAVQCDLFIGAPCLIVKSKKTKSKYIKKAAAMWRKVGAHTQIVSSEVHDKNVAIVSHLPHLLAFSLMKTAFDEMGNKAIRAAAGRSFREHTRIAAPNAHLWTQILLENSEFILKAVRGFTSELMSFEKMLVKKNKLALKKKLHSIALQRRKI